MKKKLFLLILGVIFATAISTSAFAMERNSTSSKKEGRMAQYFTSNSDFQKLLGMNAEEVKAALNSGKTFAQLLDEKHVTHAQVAEFREKQHQQMRNQHFAENKDIQNLLKMTKEDITKALVGGKTIPQLLDEHQVTHEQMQQIKKQSKGFGKHGKMNKQHEND